MREQIPAQRRDHSLRRNRQQIDLREVEQRLQRKQREEAERDSVEELGVSLHEGRVEKTLNDSWKRECYPYAEKETDDRGEEA